MRQNIAKRLGELWCNIIIYKKPYELRNFRQKENLINQVASLRLVSLFLAKLDTVLLCGLVSHSFGWEQPEVLDLVLFCMNREPTSYLHVQSEWVDVDWKNKKGFAGLDAAVNMKTRGGL